LINPLLGFDFGTRLAEYGSALDIKQLDIWASCNESTWSKLSREQCGTYEVFTLALDSAIVDLVKERVTVDGYSDIYLRMDKLTDNAYDINTGDSGNVDMNGESPYTIYYKWLTEMKYLPDTVE